VCWTYGEPLVLQDISFDWPRGTEVLVRLHSTAICGTDMHALRGEIDVGLPVVMGHEASGVVEAVGEAVTALQPNARVVISLLRSCGRCKECLSGAGNLCSAEWAMDVQGRLHAADGTRVWAGLHVGAFAELVIVDQSQLVGISDDLPLEAAAVLGCGVITGIGAVVNTAKVKPGSSVLVLGAGGVGLNVIQGARLAGATMIIASDPMVHKLHAANLFGATHAVHPRELDGGSMIRMLTAGRGVDYAFITVGKQEVVNLACESTRRGGTVVVCALPTAGSPAAIDLRYFSGDRRIVGSSMGSSRLQVDIPYLVELYRQGRIRLDELVSERFSFADINDAVRSAIAGNAIRNLVVFESNVTD